MKIEKELNGDQLVVKLEGRLDTSTAPELDSVFKESLKDVKSLTVDMAGLEYISSAGLRSLLNAKKALYNKGSVKIINANEMVIEVFEVTGFKNVFEVQAV